LTIAVRNCQRLDHWPYGRGLEVAWLERRTFRRIGGPGISTAALPYALAVKRIVLLYGLCGGVLMAALKAAEYRFIVIEHSIEIYGGAIALLFAVIGIRLGVMLSQPRPMAGDAAYVGPPVAVPEASSVPELGLTPREVEILQHIAAGKSTREIAASLFVSENTVKTHASRVFSKLNVRRRTQAVHVAKQRGLIP
jgi:NarL family two-component system response regulator LiaR